MCVCIHMCRYPQRPAESAGFPGIGITGNCEPSHMNTGNQTGVLHKSSTHSPLHKTLRVTEKNTHRESRNLHGEFYFKLWVPPVTSKSHPNEPWNEKAQSQGWMDSIFLSFDPLGGKSWLEDVLCKLKWSASMWMCPGFAHVSCGVINHGLSTMRRNVVPLSLVFFLFPKHLVVVSSSKSELPKLCISIII